MSFRGNQPDVERLKYNAQSTEPSTPLEGDTYINDGSGSIVQGLYRYNGTSFIRLDNAGENHIINSNFELARRGTTSAAGGVFIDNWRTSSNGATTSQQLFTPGQTDVPEEPKNLLRIVQPTNSESFQQRIADKVRLGAGQTIYYSFWARQTSGSFSAQTPAFDQNFGSGGSGTVTTNDSTWTPTASWVLIEGALSLPSISGKTVGSGDYLAFFPTNATGAGAKTFEFSQVWVSTTPRPKVHRTAGLTAIGELTLAKRERQVFGNFATNEAVLQGDTNGTGSQLICHHFFDVEMRATPTSIKTPTIGSFLSQNSGGSTAPTVLATDIPSVRSARITVTHTSNLTANSGGRLIRNSGVSTDDQFVLEAYL